MSEVTGQRSARSLPFGLGNIRVNFLYHFSDFLSHELHLELFIVIYLSLVILDSQSYFSTTAAEDLCGTVLILASYITERLAAVFVVDAL